MNAEECGMFFFQEWLDAIEDVEDEREQLECFFALVRYACRGEEYTGENRTVRLIFKMAFSAMKKGRSRALAGRLGGMNGKGVSRNAGNQNASKSKANQKQIKSKTVASFFNDSQDDIDNSSDDGAKNNSKTIAGDSSLSRLDSEIEADCDFQNQKQINSKTKAIKYKYKYKNLLRKKLTKKESDDSSLFVDTEPFPFSDFWGAYPHCKRKADKARCESAWSRLGNEDRQRCIEAVKVWAASDDWREQGGQFIPAPLVFLHQRRWEAALPGASRKPQSDNGVYRTPDYGEKITQMQTSGIDVKVFEVD